MNTLYFRVCEYKMRMYCGVGKPKGHCITCCYSVKEFNNFISLDDIDHGSCKRNK